MSLLGQSEKSYASAVLPGSSSHPPSMFHRNNRVLGSCVHISACSRHLSGHAIGMIMRDSGDYEMPTPLGGTLLALSTGPRLMGPSIRRFGGDVSCPADMAD